MARKVYASLWMFFLGLLISSLFVGCIKREAPNAEADILDVKVEEFELLRDAQITNNTVVLQANAWEDLRSVTPKFTLTKGAVIVPKSGEPQDFTNPVKYTVTSEDGKWSKVYTVSVQSPQEAPTHYAFEEVRLQEGIYQVFVISSSDDGNLEWQSPNLGFAIGNPAAKASEFPVCQESNGYAGACAKLTTLSTGPIGASFGKPIAAGSLFLGKLDTNHLLGDHLKSTQFGIPVYKKPLAMTGYYKYSAGETFTSMNDVAKDRKDIFDLYGILYEVTDEVKFLDGSNALSHSNLVSIARIKDAKEVADWTRFELEFETLEGKSIDAEKLAQGKYNFSIIISSSKDGGMFKGAVGSTLLVDEIEVFFE